MTRFKDFGKVFESFFNSEGKLDINGTVLIHRKNVLDLNDQVAQVGDAITDLLGGKVKLQLVSDLETENGSGVGKLSEEVDLKHWALKPDHLLADDKGTRFSVSFSLDKDFGTPSALLVVSHHPFEFLLSSLTLELPDKSQIHFPCNSWVYNTKLHDEGKPRIFFTNQVCLPNQTPPGLHRLRKAEMETLRGDGNGERKRPDRIYDYDVYNDLGNPDAGEECVRPTLGGSKEYPYPRRCRTGRSSTKTDPAAERPVELIDLVYVPRDERFGHIKRSDFLGSSIQSFAHMVIPAIDDFFTDNDRFASLQDVHKLYTSGLNLTKCASKTIIKDEVENLFKPPLELIRELTVSEDNEPSSLLKFPLPQILEVSKDAWDSDEEFARQMLSGLNPIVIEKLKDFPPESKLNTKIYGPSKSAITAQHIQGNLEGLTAQEALKKNRLYTVDYHDVYLPYIERINALQGKAYASRTLLFLRKDGTLKPVAIELSLPPNASSAGHSIKRVFVPPPAGGKRDHLWELAKTHASINDAAYHQLISHWLTTHASLEPFIIATHRQLSALHPLHLLLIPHFKNTMNINAIARKVLINSNSGQLLLGGIIERTFTPGKYSMEMSSAVYKSWRFDEQGLPADLIKRGVAVEDPRAKHGIRLLIEDYPYAVDGLDIWFAMERWVREYVAIYYKSDKEVASDEELQGWWREVKEVGHGDKKHETWWYSMHTRADLESALVTLIWTASAHHAAVNFGQYAYAGFMPNKPTMGWRLIPEPGSAARRELERDPVAFYLGTVSTQTQAAIVIATLEILSTHASDEEYLGKRSSPDWTDDPDVGLAFHRFGQLLLDIQNDIIQRNRDPALSNRSGAVGIPYTLLVPYSEEGITGKGIPNSTSI